MFFRSRERNPENARFYLELPLNTLNQTKNEGQLTAISNQSIVLSQFVYGSRASARNRADATSTAGAC